MWAEVAETKPSWAGAPPVHNDEEEDIATPVDSERQDHTLVAILNEPDDVAQGADAIKLQEIKKIVGECTTMCPEDEMEISRARSILFATTNETHEQYDFPLLIKSFSRSDAGKENIPLHIIRTPRTLYDTMKFIMTNVLGQEGNTKEWTHSNQAARTIRFSDIFNYVRDRVRCVRNDFSVQSHTSLWTIRSLEWTVRFHIMSGHLLCGHSHERGYDPKGNRDMLDDSLIDRLWGCYHAFRSKYHDPTTGEPTPGVPALQYMGEFAAYRLLYKELRQHDDHKKWKESTRTGMDNFPLNEDPPGTVFRSSDAELVSMSDMPEVLRDPLFLHAMKVIGVYACSDWRRFFSMVDSAPYLQACLMSNVFPFARGARLAYIWKAQGPKKDNIIDFEMYRQQLFFDTTDDTKRFLRALEMPVLDWETGQRKEPARKPSFENAEQHLVRCPSMRVERLREHRSHKAVCIAHGETWPRRSNAPPIPQFVETVYPDLPIPEDDVMFKDKDEIERLALEMAQEMQRRPPPPTPPTPEPPTEDAWAGLPTIPKPSPKKTKQSTAFDTASPFGDAPAKAGMGFWGDTKKSSDKPTVDIFATQKPKPASDVFGKTKGSGDIFANFFKGDTEATLAASKQGTPFDISKPEDANEDSDNTTTLPTATPLPLKPETTTETPLPPPQLVSPVNEPSSRAYSNDPEEADHADQYQEEYEEHPEEEAEEKPPVKTKSETPSGTPVAVPAVLSPTSPEGMDDDIMAAAEVIQVEQEAIAAPTPSPPAIPGLTEEEAAELYKEEVTKRRSVSENFAELLKIVLRSHEVELQALKSLIAYHKGNGLEKKLSKMVIESTHDASSFRQRIEEAEQKRMDLDETDHIVTVAPPGTTPFAAEPLSHIRKVGDCGGLFLAALAAKGHAAKEYKVTLLGCAVEGAALARYAGDDVWRMLGGGVGEVRTTRSFHTEATTPEHLKLHLWREAELADQTPPCFADVLVFSFTKGPIAAIVDSVVSQLGKALTTQAIYGVQCLSGFLLYACPEETPICETELDEALQTGLHTAGMGHIKYAVCVPAEEHSRRLLLSNVYHVADPPEAKFVSACVPLRSLVCDASLALTNYPGVLESLLFTRTLSEGASSAHDFLLIKQVWEIVDIVLEGLSESFDEVGLMTVNGTPGDVFARLLTQWDAEGGVDATLTLPRGRFASEVVHSRLSFTRNHRAQGSEVDTNATQLDTKQRKAFHYERLRQHCHDIFGPETARNRTSYAIMSTISSSLSYWETTAQEGDVFPVNSLLMAAVQSVLTHLDTAEVRVGCPLYTLPAMRGVVTKNVHSALRRALRRYPETCTALTVDVHPTTPCENPHALLSLPLADSLCPQQRPIIEAPKLPEPSTAPLYSSLTACGGSAMEPPKKRVKTVSILPGRVEARLEEAAKKLEKLNNAKTEPIRRGRKRVGEVQEVGGKRLCYGRASGQGGEGLWVPSEDQVAVLIARATGVDTVKQTDAEHALITAAKEAYTTSTAPELLETKLFSPASSVEQSTEYLLAYMRSSRSALKTI